MIHPCRITKAQLRNNNNNAIDYGIIQNMAFIQFFIGKLCQQNMSNIPGNHNTCNSMFVCCFLCIE